MCFVTMETNFELLAKQLTFFQMSVNRKGEKMVTVSCRKANILAVNRKCHHLIETLSVLNGLIADTAACKIDLHTPTSKLAETFFFLSTPA